MDCLFQSSKLEKKPFSKTQLIFLFRFVRLWFFFKSNSFFFLFRFKKHTRCFSGTYAKHKKRSLLHHYVMYMYITDHLCMIIFPFFSYFLLSFIFIFLPCGHKLSGDELLVMVTNTRSQIRRQELTGHKLSLTLLIDCVKGKRIEFQ